MSIANEISKTPQALLKEQYQLKSSREMTQAALLLHARLVEAVKKVPVEALVSLACHIFPSTSTSDSLNTFGETFLEELRSLEEHGRQIERLSKIDRDRLVPAFSKAARRIFAILDEQKLLESQINHFEKGQARKKQQLLDAGLTDAEIEQLSQPENGLVALLEKREQLIKEIATLEQFTRTRDERYLPAHFAEGILSFEEAYAQAHPTTP